MSLNERVCFKFRDCSELLFVRHNLKTERISLYLEKQTFTFFVCFTIQLKFLRYDTSRF